MWQSQVEIQHYSISTMLLRLKRCSAVLLLRVGLIRVPKLHQCLINLHSVYEPHLNRNTALQHFERGNAIEIRNGIMLDFYPGLPHMEYKSNIQWLPKETSGLGFDESLIEPCYNPWLLEGMGPLRHL